MFTVWHTPSVDIRQQLNKLNEQQLNKIYQRILEEEESWSTQKKYLTKTEAIHFVLKTLSINAGRSEEDKKKLLSHWFINTGI